MTVFKVVVAVLLAGFSAAAGEGGYLFVTFKGESSPMSEQIYFALSQDGRKWEALNQSKPVLVSTLGEKGVRDPYLVRAPDGKPCTAPWSSCGIDATNREAIDTLVRPTFRGLRKAGL